MISWQGQEKPIERSFGKPRPTMDSGATDDDDDDDNFHCNSCPFLST